MVVRITVAASRLMPGRRILEEVNWILIAASTLLVHLML